MYMCISFSLALSLSIYIYIFIQKERERGERTNEPSVKLYTAKEMASIPGIYKSDIYFVVEIS